MEPVPNKDPIKLTTDDYDAYGDLFPNHCWDCFGVGYALTGQCKTCIGERLCPTCMKPLAETDGECCSEKYETLFEGLMSRPPRYTKHITYGPMIALMMITDSYRKMIESVVAHHPDVLISILATPSVTWRDGGTMERAFFAGNLHKAVIDTMVFVERRFMNHVGHAEPAEIAQECSLMIDKGLTFVSRMYSLGSQVTVPDAVITDDSITSNSLAVKEALARRMDEYAQNPMAKPVNILMPGGGAVSLKGLIKDR